MHCLRHQPAQTLSFSPRLLCAKRLAAEIRQREPSPSEQQLRPVHLCARIGVAGAHTEPCRMAAFAILREGIRRHLQFPFSDAHDPEIGRFQKKAHMRPRGADREHVAVAKTGHGFRYRQSRTQSHALAFKPIGDFSRLSVSHDD
ncbi:protein of unknown function (plasmid) [Methylocella tundrae]|uniref:Uncharacterized protein n=1 Tax=Methylocella tundrae TaxID=227605 RepID=A0A4U8Z7Q2_METTU|nr:protein of unknown function [Methylocella tundrae]